MACWARHVGAIRVVSTYMLVLMKIIYIVNKLGEMTSDSGLELYNMFAFPVRGQKGK